jgi:hypothetical protein
MDADLLRPRQRAWDHLAVDRVGDLELSALHANQAEPQGVAQVVVERVRRERRHCEHGLQDPPDPRLAQAGDQRVDVGPPLQDDRLLRRLDVLHGHRDAAISQVLPDDLVGERVGQPGVPLRELPDPADRLGLEALAGRRRVLREQLPDLGSVNGPSVVASAVMLNGDVVPSQDSVRRSSVLRT